MRNLTGLSFSSFKSTKIDVKAVGKEYPYWKENGWRRFNGEYAGHFVSDFGRWRGVINESYLGKFNFYIFDPPKELLKGSHKACFTYKGNSRYFIHFSKKPRDVSSGIITVEKLISDSFRAERNKRWIS